MRPLPQSVCKTARLWKPIYVVPWANKTQTAVPMLASMAANLPRRRGPNRFPVRNSRKRSSRLPRPISCRGNVLRIHPTPGAMFIARGIDAPQMLHDVESARSGGGAHDVRARRLPQFPATLDLKTRTELCCILSGITAPRIYVTSERSPALSDRIIGCNPRRNPDLSAT
jgi:hypothetical protein